MRGHRYILAIGLPWALLVACVLTGVWLAARAYCYHHADLGIYSQALAGLARGSLNPFLSGRQVNVFNDHVDPILFLVAPLARVFSPWKAALVGELLMVSAAALPLWWLLRRWAVDGATALLLGSLLFLEPAVLRAVRYPVHPTTWAMAPMMLVVAALLLERWLVMLVGLVLLFACKEEFPFCGVMLGLALWQSRRRVALAVLGLAVVWLLGVFVLRPLLLGGTHPHGPAMFTGLTDGPLTYLRDRLTAPGLASGLWDFALPFLPLFVWMAWRRASWSVPLIAIALPTLAIRFLGMSWRHHYMAVLVPLAIGLVAASLRDRSPPRWLLALPMVLLVVLGAGSVRFTLARLGAPVAAEPRFCPATSQRLGALDAAVASLLERSGPALISANLFPQLSARDELYALAGFQPSSTRYQWALLEKPPNGDPYPLTASDVDALLPKLREQATTVHVDDDALFFAEGEFSLAP